MFLAIHRAPFLVLIRPLHWLKNILVFAGVFFGHAWHDNILMTKAALLFAAFCCSASGVYVINDYFDRHIDRVHPKKRHRPIASGQIDPRMAMLKAHILLATGWVLAWYSGSGIAFGAVVAYTLMNFAYSKWLKHIVIIDVGVLAASYLIRVIAGTEGLGIPISSWLFLCGLAAAMFVGFGKRLSEKYILEVKQQRKSVVAYSEEFLKMALTVSAAIFLALYGLYTLDMQSMLVHGRKLVLTFPWAIFAVFRYMQMVVDKNPLAEDPATLIFRDWTIGGVFVAWLVTFIMVMAW